MPTRSDPGDPAPDPLGAPAPDPSDSGPLKTLSFFVLLALAVEIALLAWLGQAAA